MAIIFRCDRCLRIFVNRNDVKEVTFPYMAKYGREFTDEDDSYAREICAPCVSILNAAYDGPEGRQNATQST